MGSLIPETAQKLFTAEGLKAAAEQSKRLLQIPRKLQKAIENFIQEQEKQDMKKKVLNLSQAMKEFKNVSTELESADGYETFRDLFEANDRSRRWKIKSTHGDGSLKYKEGETAAYVAARMPAVYSAAHRVLREVLIEPGTPQGSSIIRQIRSHILWMEKKKCRKSETTSKGASTTPESTMDSSSSSEIGAFVVAPCAHDGVCPMDKTGSFCHFVQRLERTYSQRTYKTSRVKGKALRGYEDEKFSFVVLRRGQRPSVEGECVDGRTWIEMMMTYATTIKDQFETEPDDVISQDGPEEGSDVSDETESEDICEEQQEGPVADLGSGWGRIIFSPVRRGKRITMDVCHSTKRDGSEGSLDRMVISKSKNPTLHHQARRSLWGDLWPF